jgi:type II secretory ATPase GspE/PulE/Tfp pilus assembly ATPase PilB-like protein
LRLVTSLAWRTLTNPVTNVLHYARSAWGNKDFGFGCLEGCCGASADGWGRGRLNVHGCSRCEGRGRTWIEATISRAVVLSEDPVSVRSENTVVRSEPGPAAAVGALARDAGMKTLREDGLRLIREGVTTPEEVLRITAAD